MTSLVELQGALRQDPRNAGLWIRMGLELHGRGRNPQALTCFERALQLAPGHVDATYNRGVVLHALGRVPEALACYEETIARFPGHPAAEDNRLAALVALERGAEASAGLERRLATGPRDPDTLVNLGLARETLGDFAAALAAYEEALERFPGHRLAGWNLALLELRLGRTESGLARYEAYWPGTAGTHRVRDLGRPLWRPGMSLEGRSLLLHADEGFGDTIQALRFVPVAVRRARRVVLEVPGALAELARSLDPGLEIAAAGDALPDTDLHAPLHGLALRIGAQDGAPVPYLHAKPERIAHWRARLGEAGALNVGLAWRGSPAYARDRQRSIPLAALRPLFDVEGASLVGLQLDPPPEDAEALAQPGAPRDLASPARGLAETAALACALDLVISVDTSIAHLALALGRPTWVLLDAHADPRWREAIRHSEAYPAATLHRAARGESWADVVARVRSELQRFVKLRP